MYIWNNEYSRNFKADGKQYELHHLKPITFDMALKFIGTVQVKVFFSAHVFTEEYKNYKHDPSLKIQFMRYNNPDIRGFDLSRYIWSKALPNIFANISPSTKIHNAGRGYYLAIPNTMNYQIYFELSYDNIHNQVKLYVKTAYCKRNTERNFQRYSLKDCIRKLL